MGILPSLGIERPSDDAGKQLHFHNLLYSFATTLRTLEDDIISDCAVLS